ncbi:MAG: RtcB family protein [Deltaproteobacteria bacterium]|nr:RtcB family protein [Deltaproteobacteria bacterium]
MSSSFRVREHVSRADDTHVRITHPDGVPMTLMATADVPIEDEAIVQAVDFARLAGTLDDLWQREQAGAIAPFWGDAPGRLERVVLTPDLHRGGGIPVGTVAACRGFVVPQAVGNDVCCGMRLVVTDITTDELAPHLDALARPLRHAFFEGGRDVPLSPRQREAILREGVGGLASTFADNADLGVWRGLRADRIASDLARSHLGGGLPARGLHAFGDWIRSSGSAHGRDAQIGSIGGGNHFVELQVVDGISDGRVAHAWGVTRGRVAIMAHSGSVGLGHLVGGHFADLAKALYPTGVPHPEHGFYALPTRGPHGALAAKYLDALANAANFAFVNRLVLAGLAVRVLGDVLGREVDAQLIYDAPHNLIWPGEDDRYLHRKGACPAPGPDGEGRFAWTGHPVIIPGSMGAASWLLAGEGNDAALCSACHGAGRSVARGAARHVDAAVWDDARARLRVVTPVDMDDPVLRRRRDIVARHDDRLKEEGPWAYKDVTPVVDTVERAGVARKVARLWPLLTIKG